MNMLVISNWLSLIALVNWMYLEMSQRWLRKGSKMSHPWGQKTNIYLHSISKPWA